MSLQEPESLLIDETNLKVSLLSVIVYIIMFLITANALNALLFSLIGLILFEVIIFFTINNMKMDRIDKVLLRLFISIIPIILIYYIFNNMGILNLD